MDYDRALEAPYEAKAKQEDKIERIVDDMIDRPEDTFSEFLAWFAEEPNDVQIIAAVKQRDFEALGGLLYKRYQEYVWEAAEIVSEV